MRSRVAATRSSAEAGMTETRSWTMTASGPNRWTASMGTIGRGAQQAALVHQQRHDRVVVLAHDEVLHRVDPPAVREAVDVLTDDGPALAHGGHRGWRKRR